MNCPDWTEQMMNIDNQNTLYNQKISWNTRKNRLMIWWQNWWNLKILPPGACLKPAAIGNHHHSSLSYKQTVLNLHYLLLRCCGRTQISPTKRKMLRKFWSIPKVETKILPGRWKAFDRTGRDLPLYPTGAFQPMSWGAQCGSLIRVDP